MASIASGRASGVASSSVRWRLGARTRKGFLVVHIASAGAWLGIDVVMGVFIFTALFSDDVQAKAFSLQALEVFVFWSLLSAGLVCLATGVVLGWGTKYGLVRYWWVAVKLVLNIVLTSLVTVLLRPGVTEAAEQARQVTAGDGGSVVVGDLLYPPIVSTTALLVAMVLSVYKPWGRIRKGVPNA